MIIFRSSILDLNFDEVAGVHPFLTNLSDTVYYSKDGKYLYQKMTETFTSVGVVSIGEMGLGVASLLIDHGYQVFTYAADRR